MRSRRRRGKYQRSKTTASDSTTHRVRTPEGKLSDEALNGGGNLLY